MFSKPLASAREKERTRVRLYYTGRRLFRERAARHFRKLPLQADLGKIFRRHLVVTFIALRQNGVKGRRPAIRGGGPFEQGAYFVLSLPFDTAPLQVLRQRNKAKK